MTDQQARALLSRVFGALFDSAATAEDVGAILLPITARSPMARKSTAPASSTTCAY